MNPGGDFSDMHAVGSGGSNSDRRGEKTDEKGNSRGILWKPKRLCVLTSLLWSDWRAS